MTTTRRAQAAWPESCAIGRFEISRGGHTITLPDGGLPDPTSSEFDPLQVLDSCAGEVVSRNEVMLQLHGIKFSDLDRTIDDGISKLRAIAYTPQLIKTVRCKGATNAANWNGIEGVRSRGSSAAQSSQTCVSIK